MKQEPIIHSPNAYDPISHMLMSDEEKKKMYHRHVNDLEKPSSVIDVIRDVYHRSFSTDLIESLSDPVIVDGLKKAQDKNSEIRYWVNKLDIRRVESVYDQPASNFYVDILVDTRVKIQETIPGGILPPRRFNLDTELRLRYKFDLRPCELNCWYVGVITDEKKSIYNIYPNSIHLNRYLLPVIQTSAEYERLALDIIKEYLPEYLDSDKPISSLEWLERMGLRIYSGVFPERSVTGEYFFGFGLADIYDLESGEIIKDAHINPGTVVLNMNSCNSSGIINTTVAHEGTHHELCYFYFMLQLAHGKMFSSYLCKRFDRNKPRKSTQKWNPVDIMEMQANKLPGYLLIQRKPGEKKAKELLESYGGERTLPNMTRLVSDMAEHFKTTKRMAKNRLIEFGYVEVSGVGDYIAGERVPTYLSDLGKNETYTVDEKDAIKEYVFNRSFREVIDTGLYLYTEGHYCLKSDKYLVYDQYGRRHLTPYARTHMSECCLVFEISYDNAIVAIKNSVLCKSNTDGKRIKFRKQSGESLITEEGKELRRRAQEAVNAKQRIKRSFGDITVDLMQQNHFTVERLVQETGISVRTIQNMRNAKGKSFRAQEIIAVCIAMHLDPLVSKAYLAEAPTVILDTVDMELYQYALAEWYDKPVADVNRLLVECEAEPLTNLVTGFDENGNEILDA